MGQGDITTEAIVPRGTNVLAQIVLKQPAVVCGLNEVKVLFEMLGVKFFEKVKDGDETSADTVIAEIEGDGQKILTAERTALNLLMRMSGIATETRKLVKEIQKIDPKIRIAATRKTAPGLRYFDKKAVITGGGYPHRMKLDDAFLVKDNHITIAGEIREALKKIQLSPYSSKKVEVEVKTREQAVQAAELGVDIVMLDNMSLKEAAETMKELSARNLRHRVQIEISGGVTSENLVSYAMLRPDIISLGSLTHSVKAVDMSLEVIKVNAPS
ncbi:carboxylating nicotinate-nucleotide diphosphorylase [Candidatus Bathyarchaeota archaeon]|nr:carboxylating nicotinate-nucleotide diphosphorylase [Candidatus Bathyarchaeota archaeon]